MTCARTHTQAHACTHAHILAHTHTQQDGEIIYETPVDASTIDYATLLRKVAMLYMEDIILQLYCVHST